jgi:hypothetical protein
MRKLTAVTLAVIFTAGCNSVRLGPSELQKQNAWAHMQATRMVAGRTRMGDCSSRTCALADLSAAQAEAFVADYGMPESLPAQNTAEDFPSEDSYRLAEQARQDAQQRMDPWDAADCLFELGAGLAGLLGGVYGARAARFIGEARKKSQALKEIVEGNELFKKRNPSAVSDFKDAHSCQSSTTRQMVASLK